MWRSVSVSSRKTVEKQRKKLVRGKLDRNCKCKKGKLSPILRLEEGGDFERMIITSHADNELVFGTSFC